MTDFPSTIVRVARAGADPKMFYHYSNAAITTGNQKWEWVNPFYLRIIDVICDSEVAGSGGTSDIVDVKINGTSIYAQTADRPTLLAGDTGTFTQTRSWTKAPVPGDIFSYDVIQQATTGSSRFKICIICVLR